MATKEGKTFNYILLDIAWQKCRAFGFRVFVLNLAIEIWVYNDNVNSPKIRKWLGQGILWGTSVINLEVAFQTI